MGDMTGSAYHVTFKGTTITPDYREFTDGNEMGLVDSSAGADTVRTFLATLLEGKATFKGLYQGGTGATDIYNLLAPGARGTLIISPEGTATNKPKTTINSVWVKSRERNAPYDDLVELSVEFQYDAAVSDGAW